MRGKPAALRVFLLFCRQFLKFGREKEKRKNDETLLQNFKHGVGVDLEQIRTVG